MKTLLSVIYMIALISFSFCASAQDGKTVSLTFFNKNKKVIETITYNNLNCGLLEVKGKATKICYSFLGGKNNYRLDFESGKITISETEIDEQVNLFLDLENLKDGTYQIKNVTAILRPNGVLKIDKADTVKIKIE